MDGTIPEFRVLWGSSKVRTTNRRIEVDPENETVG